MHRIWRYLLALFLTCLLSTSAGGHTFSVKIVTEQPVNIVDTKFLSFSVDPKYLFADSEKYNDKQRICMATSLTPAYLRISGPSTSHLAFHNTTLFINDPSIAKTPKRRNVLGIFNDRLQSKGHFRTKGHLRSQTNAESDAKEDLSSKSAVYRSNFAVTLKELMKFVQWANSTGFNLVFALNNNEKTSSGIWDPNTALNILTAAEKVNITNAYWQLGHECVNQSIEEYLNDLETLKVIVETFPPGSPAGGWRVVGGDVTRCLQADSKSDFRDYVTLSAEMLDAILLNGNSSTQELQRMSELDRMRLLKSLSVSTTPLWLTEISNPQYNELERAADWMSSLGYSARNGFSVHFRELMEQELFEPTLSFYMALLYKNLVGEKVLYLEMELAQAVLFAHCTSLRHKKVPGALTLYGVNMDDEPARFSLKMSKKEEGGDIMQFILGNDPSGNIIVNGRPMYYEGDIRPVVKRVRPYKTLLINLPPKSFGFWVLANTNIDACRDSEEEDSKTEADEDVVSVDDENDGIFVNNIRRKRVIDISQEYVVELDKCPEVSYDFVNTKENTDLRNEVKGLQSDLNSIRDSLKTKPKRVSGKKTRVKRQLFGQQDEDIGKNRLITRAKKSKRRNLRKRFFDPSNLKNNLFNLMSQLSERVENTKNIINYRFPKYSRGKIFKRKSNPRDQDIRRSDENI